MDSRQLRYFAAIHEEGSLARAAERERVAVSALSRHLANLEAEFGMALFVRLPRGVRPTASGTRLYEHARTILRSMQAARDDLRETQGEVSGEVSVGFAHSVIKSVGVDLMKRVSQDHPLLRLHLCEIFSGATVQQLVSSAVDMTLTFNQPPNPKLRFQPVLEEKMVLLGRPDILGSTDPIGFDDLLQFPLIILREGLYARALLDDASLLRRIEEKAQFQINSIAAIGQVALSGIGCLIGTEHILSEYLETGELIARPIEEPMLSRTLYLGEVIDRPVSLAFETIQKLSIDLTVDAVITERWKASLADQFSQ